jgi:hypothetical protein
MAEIGETGRRDGGEAGNAHNGSFPRRPATPCISAGLLAEIRELHRRNAEHLSDGRRLRARRDDILTAAAAIGGRLVRDGVHRDPAALADLAEAAGAAFDGRSLREPLTLLARVVIGPGRSRNAYTTVGKAAAFAAASRGNDLEAVIRGVGGVTGAAARYGAANLRPGPGAETRPQPPAAGTVPLVAAAGVLAAIPADRAPCHAVIRRAGEDVIELLIVAGTAHARLSLGPASPHDPEAGVPARWRALRPLHLGVVDGVRIAVAECTPAVCEAVRAGEATVLAVAAGGAVAGGLAEGLSAARAAPPGTHTEPRRPVQPALPGTRE